MTDTASIVTPAIYQIHRAAGAADGAGGVSLGIVAAAVGGGGGSCGLAVMAALVGTRVTNCEAVLPFNGLVVI